MSNVLHKQRGQLGPENTKRLTVNCCGVLQQDEALQPHNLKA